jgi:hypothetical protein
MFYWVFAKFIFTHSPCTTGCSPSLSSHTTHVLLGVCQVYLHTQPLYYWVFAKFIFTHSTCTTGCLPSVSSHKALVLLGVRQVYLHTQPLYYWVFAKCIFTHSTCTTGCSPSVSSHTAHVLLGVRRLYLHTHSHCTRICTTFLEQLRYLKELSMKCFLLRRAVGSTAPDVSKALRRTFETAVTTFPVKRRNQQYLYLQKHPQISQWLYFTSPVQVAARSKAWICGRSLVGFAGSNPPGRHGCLSFVSVVCCQVEVSATGWSLVQRSPAECGVSVCDHESSITRRPWPTGDYCAIVKNVTSAWLHFIEYVAIKLFLWMSTAQWRRGHIQKQLTAN